MSASYSVEVSEQAKAIVRNLRDTAAVNQVACKIIDQQNQLTLAYILAHNLSGPGKKDLTTLAVVSGFLRRSSHATPARNYGGVVLSSIGANVKYAAAHEFGFSGTVNVRAHARRNAMADTFDYHGTAVNRLTALRGGILSRKQASQTAIDSGKYAFRSRKAKQVMVGGLVMVKAHSMHMNLPARRCFQRGIEQRIGEYGPALSAAIIRGWSTKP